MIRDFLQKWINGEYDLFDHLPDEQKGHDISREEEKLLERRTARYVDRQEDTLRIADTENRAFRFGYRLLAAVSCLVLAAVFLYMTAHITAYGMENPRAETVAKRYIEKGIEETGAVNAVAGMILDYRAFDTLGESHVLFTALMVVMILLRVDSRNMQSTYEDYYRIRFEQYYPTEKDPILRRIGTVNGCLILLFGIYILVSGHLGPGGGFSGGAVLGTGMIILATALGDETMDRVLTQRRFQALTAVALCFYSLAKGYVFITGANGFENIIPKGVPGTLLSAGLIPPLNIAVGAVVGCTMFGFYGLFRRGWIGEVTTDA